MSSGHFVRMYMIRKIVNIMCERSHRYDESEWSLTTSLICRFWCPYEESAGRYGSGSPQRWRSRWRRQGTIRKGFVNSTEIVSAATKPSDTIEITCNQANFLRNHDGTKSENELLGDAFVLGVDDTDVQRHYSEDLLTTDCGTTK